MSNLLGSFSADSGKSLGAFGLTSGDYYFASGAGERVGVGSRVDLNWRWARLHPAFFVRVETLDHKEYMYIPASA